jgi:hypothetical protein
VVVPAVVVTLTVPLVAPAGTVTVSLVALAAVTVAAIPLNRTVFPAGVGANAVPLIVTLDPTLARRGTTQSTESVAVADRLIASRLPEAS